MAPAAMLATGSSIAMHNPYIMAAEPNTDMSEREPRMLRQAPHYASMAAPSSGTH
jgi:hypothetical protein